jgi:hypothetical protein
VNTRTAAIALAAALLLAGCTVNRGPNLPATSTPGAMGLFSVTVTGTAHIEWTDGRAGTGYDVSDGSYTYGDNNNGIQLGVVTVVPTGEGSTASCKTIGITDQTMPATDQTTSPDDPAVCWAGTGGTNGQATPSADAQLIQFDVMPGSKWPDYAYRTIHHSRYGAGEDTRKTEEVTDLGPVTMIVVSNAPDGIGCDLTVNGEILDTDQARGVGAVAVCHGDAMPTQTGQLAVTTKHGGTLRWSHGTEVGVTRLGLGQTVLNLKLGDNRMLMVTVAGGKRNNEVSCALTIDGQTNTRTVSGKNAVVTCSHLDKVGDTASEFEGPGVTMSATSEAGGTVLWSSKDLTQTGAGLQGNATISVENQPGSYRMIVANTDADPGDTVTCRIADGDDKLASDTAKGPGAIAVCDAALR